MLRFKSLSSGSSGNATLVEAGSSLTRTRLLIDCGLGPRQLDQRLGRAGLAIQQIDAIFITHEHADHIGSACAVALKHGIPIWMSRGTHRALGEPELHGLLRLARDQTDIEIKDLRIRPFTVPHDAREPLQLCCSDGDVILGVLTDLGHASSHVLRQLSACHALLLECNHDRDMLAASSYPPFLKKRVGGDFGHLANPAAAEILRAVAHHGLRRVVAAHLSEQNNRPELAQAALAEALNCQPAEIGVALARVGTEWMDV